VVPFISKNHRDPYLFSSVGWDPSTVAAPFAFMVYCQSQFHRWRFWAAR
jgi:hypothetical protein